MRLALTNGILANMIQAETWDVNMQLGLFSLTFAISLRRGFSMFLPLQPEKEWTNMNEPKPSQTHRTWCRAAQLIPASISWTPHNSQIKKNNKKCCFKVLSFCGGLFDNDRYKIPKNRFLTSFIMWQWAVNKRWRKHGDKTILSYKAQKIVACVMWQQHLKLVPAVTQLVKNPPAVWGMMSNPGFDPWVGKIPWRRGKDSHSTILAWRIPWTV